MYVFGQEGIFTVLFRYLRREQWGGENADGLLLSLITY